MSPNNGRSLFGTDGIRGIANGWPMDSVAALRAGQAIAAWFKTDARRHKIVVGKDTRLSGYMLETALASGLVAMGVDVYLVGPLPTPGIAFITTGMRADAGVVISASHNSYEYNGIKIFDRSGYKLSDDVEYELERFMLDPSTMASHIAPHEGIGKAFRVDDAIGRYVVALKSTFPRELTLDGLKIVVDCANGATYKVAPEVLTELGATVHPVGVSPNGMNINRGVGSTATEIAQQRVREIGADIGLALDGDGDRLIVIDEHGDVVDGDAMLAFIGAHMLQQGRLANDTLVATIMSNIGLDRAIEGAGGKVERTGVGDRYVSQRMRDVGSNFGGESSGHMIFLDSSTTGDGTLAALMVLRVMLETGKTISELAAIMQRTPQVMHNVSVRDKVPVETIDGLESRQILIQKELGSSGRVLLWYSGTENKLRILVEGENGEKIKEYADALRDIVSSAIGTGD